MFTTISLMVTGVLGMLGWLAAWRARGEVVSGNKAVQSALASEAMMRVSTFSSDYRAKTAEAKLAAELERADLLDAQLARERKSRQALVDALAKAGVAVGDVVVESSLDRLYPDSDRDQGGQGSDSGASGDRSAVPGEPAAPPSSSSR